MGGRQRFYESFVNILTYAQFVHILSPNHLKILLKKIITYALKTGLADPSHDHSQQLARQIEVQRNYV